MANKKFTHCSDRSKSKFYSSFNAIYGKLGKIGDPMVTLNLISSVALPCLLYAQEALHPLTKTSAKSIEHPWSRVFMKVFNTFNNKIVTQCQFYTGYLPVEHIIAIRKLKFVQSLKFSPCFLLRALHDLSGQEELSRLSCTYGASVETLLLNPNDIISDHFVTYANTLS